ncbi:hypothetical protein KC669_03805, partial [Candidatus Dojkabacteria bacterium]|nr:hypothetical protein [Candidatus Dojkabacteria bacterium]
KEETNLESKNIKSIECVGLILSTKTNFIFIFNISLKLNKEELISIFKTRSDDEMKDLIFVPKEELKGYLSDKGGYRPLVPELL